MKNAIIKKQARLEEIANDTLIMERLIDRDGKLFGTIGVIELTFTLNKHQIGAPIFPSDIFGVPKDGLSEGSHNIEVCGVPFKVEVVGIKESIHEFDSMVKQDRWTASLNR